MLCAFGPLGYSDPAYVFGNNFVFNIVIFLSVSPEAVSVKGCPLLLSFFTISVRMAPGLFL